MGTFKDRLQRFNDYSLSSSYWEDVVLKLDESFYNEHESWIIDPTSTYNFLVDKCFDKKKTASQAAALIQRMRKIYEATGKKTLETTP